MNRYPAASKLSLAAPNTGAGYIFVPENKVAFVMEGRTTEISLYGINLPESYWDQLPETENKKSFFEKYHWQLVFVVFIIPMIFVAYLIYKKFGKKK